VLFGKRGPLVVDGQTYDGLMVPPAGLADAELALLLDHVVRAWEPAEPGAEPARFTAAELAALRAAGPVALATPAPTRYPLRGRVRAADWLRHEITLAHEEIPGFMPAMTMTLRVEGQWWNVIADDEVRATLVVTGNESWLEDLALTQPSKRRVNAAPPGLPPRPAQPGAALPALTLVDQHGQSFELAGLRGQALALTFLYTRCPLPDFCPALMRRFQQLARTLEREPELAQRVQLLSVSFDPDHDTPAVLAAYGRPFQLGPETRVRWRLATGAPASLRQLTAFFGLSVVQEQGEFSHELLTAVVTPEGRVAHVFEGTRVGVDEIVTELRRVLGAPGARQSVPGS
jgi:protein SCO1/2